MDKVDILKRAKGLIDKPDNWFKGFYYNNREVSGPDFNCLCGLGAAIRAVNPNVNVPVPFQLSKKDFEIFEELRIDLTDMAREIHGFDPINDFANFNDDTSTSHQDVMEVFDKTIERLSKNA